MRVPTWTLLVLSSAACILGWLALFGVVHVSSWWFIEGAAFILLLLLWRIFISKDFLP